MITGVFWTSVQRYSGIVVQLIVSAILARLISPEDFGIVAIATVLISFLAIFADMGIAPAIVQHKNLSQNDLNHIFSITVYGGLLLSILFFLSSYSISAFYQKESLTFICRILSINLLFASLNIVPNALVTKNKEFKFIAQRTLFFQIMSGSIAVLAAYNGLGIYSLLISPVFTSIGVFVVNYFKYRQHFYVKVNLYPIKQIFSFAAFQFLFSFMNYFSRNLDKLIIGKYLTLTDLGYYEKSYRLMMLPLQSVTQVITPVMHPVLSALQDNRNELANKYNQIIKLLATIGFPLGIVIFFTAKEIILIVFGNQWTNAIPALQILSLSVPIQILLSSTGSIFQSAGRTNWLFYTGVINTLIQVTGFILAALFYKTIEAFAWFWDISCVLTVLSSYFFLYKIVLCSSLRKMLKGIIVPTVNAFLVAIVLYVIDRLNVESIVVMLTFKIVLSVIVSYLIIQYSHHFDINSLIKKYFKKQKNDKLFSEKNKKNV